MLHITEDTPADMLSGAMDLTIHLPSGKAVKMCVERSTPMMDLLVNITTKHQLQITNHTLQPLQTAPNDSYPENILSYYPNTPIGTLDTQHVKVVPKMRSLLIPKNVPPGHQPFESTFRLKVHLPRNQLYVTRVSRHVHIEDIMQKVCEEKNLDPKKFEVRHPGNLDEVLDPKLTLNDYMITEIYLILKGSNSLTQAFTSNDIMTLRKEEERKQMHNKTGGGVFNLIFRRGKTNVSIPAPLTENPICPQRNEESRTTPPPATPLEIIPPPKIEVPTEKPKPPQRKRRPAPKPPKPVVEEQPQKEIVEMRISSSVSDDSTTNSDNVPVKNDTGLTICHSRHSSDSSGYHETSILSDNCNTSLPRKSRLEEGETAGKSLNRRSESTGNLSKMVVQSRSTSSLAFPGRKKKTAPPPPTPLLKSTSSSMNLEHPSPVVASQTPSSSSPSRTDMSFAPQGSQNTTIPPLVPRRRKGPVAAPRPRSIAKKYESENNSQSEEVSGSFSDSFHSCPYHEGERINEDTVDSSRPPSNMSTTDILKSLEYLNLDEQGNEIKPPEIIGAVPKSNQIVDNNSTSTTLRNRHFVLDLVDQDIDDDNTSIATESLIRGDSISVDSDISSPQILLVRKQLAKDFSITSVKSLDDVYEESTMKRWGSWEKLNQSPSSITSSNIEETGLRFPEPLENSEFETASIDSEYNEVNETVTDDHNAGDVYSIQQDTQSVVSDAELKRSNIDTQRSSIDTQRSSIETQRSSIDTQRSSIDTQKSGIGTQRSNIDTQRSGIDTQRSSIDTVNNILSEEEQKRIDIQGEKEEESGDRLNQVLYSCRNKWVVGGDCSDTESISSTGHQTAQNKLDLILENSPEALGNRTATDNLDNISKLDEIPPLESPFIDVEKREVSLEDIGKFINYEKSPKDSGNSSDISEKSKNDEDIINVEVLDVSQDINEEEHEEWQLPSPPKAFKDLTQDPQDLESETTETDSILTPELLKKLRELEERESVKQTERHQSFSDNNSNAEDEERLILNKLSLENLEKRKSLVYNRELATSLKSSYESNENILNKRYRSDLDLSRSLNTFEKTLEEIRNENTKNIERSASIKASVTQSTLPNFKITTYDEPKQKIKVFEDDTIRSNSEATKKSYTLDRVQSLQKTYTGRSMENISIRNEEDTFKKPKDIEHRLFNPKNRSSRVSVNRSGSFSSDQNEWSPSKPVARSKSQVAIIRDDISNRIQSGNMSKSSSLFDVSGLQSLEVMRKIQDKLNTPTASMETLVKTETVESQQELRPEPVDTQKVTLRKYQYSGPPSINMGTWSERPKIPVSVKEDADYKLGRGTNRPHSEIIANTQNVPLTNTVEIRHTTVNKLYNFPSKTETQNVTIKINGCEPISAQKNNVLIKIGEQNSRFHDFNTPIVYRTPLNTLNRNSPRPHSVAFPSDFDISRVPVVRSVELKKSFQESRNNTSVTHLNQPKGNYFSNGFSEKSKYLSSENLTNNSYVRDNVSKPVFRAKSFLQPAPVVKGFRSFGSSANNNATNGSNNKIHSSMTLPSSAKQNYATNQHVPFSKFNLRRTESTKICENEQNPIEFESSEKTTISTPIESLRFEKKDVILSSKSEQIMNNNFVPPAPPQMPKVVQKRISNRQFVPVLDPRDELLKSIRNFGGKKGLRSRKA